MLLRVIIQELNVLEQSVLVHPVQCTCQAAQLSVGILRQVSGLNRR